MAELFIAALLGHLVGDYLLQSKHQALNKTQKNWYGFWCCLQHTLIYTFSVSLFLWTASPIIWLLIFLSHWPIDRYSLTTVWLKLIKGRDLLQAYNSSDKYREIDISFSCLVYAVADNTLHLTLLWLIIKHVKI